MAPRSRVDEAGLAHQVWRLLCVQAGQSPGEFIEETRDEAAGWLWEGSGAALMRRVGPELPDGDRRGASEYLQATGMMVNVRGHSTGARPLWFIRKDWHGGPAGHVHVMQEPGLPREEAVQAAVRAEAAGEDRYQGVAEAVRDLVTHAGEVEANLGRLQAEAAELRAENAQVRAEADQLRAGRDRLVAENIRLRDVARQVTELLAEFQGGRPEGLPVSTNPGKKTQCPESLIRRQAGQPND